MIEIAHFLLQTGLLAAIVWGLFNTSKRLKKLEDGHRNLYAYIDELAIQVRAKKEDLKMQEQIDIILKEIIFKREGG